MFLRDELARVSGNDVWMMSGVSGEGIQDILRSLRDHIDENRLRHRQDDQEDVGSWQP